MPGWWPASEQGFSCSPLVGLGLQVYVQTLPGICEGRPLSREPFPATALPSLPSPDLWRLNTELCLCYSNVSPLRYMLKPVRQSLTEPQSPGRRLTSRPLASVSPIRSTISQTYDLRHLVGHQLPVEACQWVRGRGRRKQVLSGRSP